MGSRCDVYRKYKNRSATEQELLLLREVLPTNRYNKIKNNSFNKDKVVDEEKLVSEYKEQTDNQKVSEKV